MAVGVGPLTINETSRGTSKMSVIRTRQVIISNIVFRRCRSSSRDISAGGAGASDSGRHL